MHMQLVYKLNNQMYVMSWKISVEKANQQQDLSGKY